MGGTNEVQQMLQPCDCFPSRPHQIGGCRRSTPERIIILSLKLDFKEVTLAKFIMRKTKTSLGGLSSLPLLNLWLFTKVPLLDFVSCTQISLKFDNITARYVAANL